MNNTLARLAVILRGEADTGFLRAVPDTGWLALIGIANRDRHLIVPALHESLSRPDLRAALPADVRGYLALVAEANAQRNAEIREDVVAVLHVLNAAGVRPMLLKGAATLMDARRAVPGRMVGDIDILVPPGQEGAALGALRAAGFAPLAPTGVAHTIADLGRPGDRACIDLHRALLNPPFDTLLPTQAVFARAETMARDGLRALLPSLEDHARFVVLHAQISQRCYYHRQLCLGAAREIAALAAIDWEAMASWAAAGRLRPVLEAMLLVAGDFFGLPWPLGGAASRTARHHHRLACAVEMSGSWAVGLGRLARLRESVAPDRLVAGFGPGRGYVGNVARLLGHVVRQHGVRGTWRRIRAA